MMKRNIDSYFEAIIENINIIMNNDFYDEKDKINLEDVKEKMKKWYKTYKEEETLKNIDIKTLEYIDLEITDFFDKYLVKESVKDNYSERLSYDFGKLEDYWKNEMLGEKNK